MCIYHRMAFLLVLAACLLTSCANRNDSNNTSESVGVWQTVVTTKTASVGVETSTPTYSSFEQTEWEDDTSEVILSTETTTEETMPEETTSEVISPNTTQEETTMPIETTKPPKETIEETTQETTFEPKSLPAIITPSEAVIAARIYDLRDPCVLKANNRYYVFGTDWQGYYSASQSLDGRWIKLEQVVEVPADSDGDHWAPEVYEYKGVYYMFTTYKSKETGRRGCAIFRSDKPCGPYKLHSDGHVTPKEWDAIDGSLYVDKDGQPWMVFVHEWVSTDDNVGRMACAKLSQDLKAFISEPVELFRADDAPWAAWDITDGCWVYRCQDDSLLMIWSNWDKDGYCIGVAKSASGEVTGPWEQMEERLFSKESLGDFDGGHGMIFTDYDGKLWLSLHSPNDGDVGIPRPLFIPIKEENNWLVWDLKKR